MMEPDEPENGGSKDGNHMDNDESWSQINRKCKTATERGKSWGRHTSAHGNDARDQVKSQGLPRTAVEHDFFTRNTLHKLPVLITSANGTPVSTVCMI
jgi:hypothetical protein